MIELNLIFESFSMEKKKPRFVSYVGAKRFALFL